jgi:hypothetical protein
LSITCGAKAARLRAKFKTDCSPGTNNERKTILGFSFAAGQGPAPHAMSKVCSLEQSFRPDEFSILKTANSKIRAPAQMFVRGRQ